MPMPKQPVEDFEEEVGLYSIILLQQIESDTLNWCRVLLLLKIVW